MENNLNNKDIPKKTSLYQKISLILFGLFLTVVILEIILRIGGLTILSLQEHKNLQSIKQKGSFRIMCLGESTTQNQYPPYLEEILNKRDIGIKFSVIDKGIGGTNTLAILLHLEANLDKYQPDIVVTMMGINDCGSHMPYEATSSSKIILIFRSLKSYKLIRLLWLHIVTRLKEKGFYVQDINKQKNSPKETYKEPLQEPVPEKTLDSNPKNDSEYVKLGGLYKRQGKRTEAEQSFKKAIELNSNNDYAYTELGKLYKVQWKFTEAEQSFKKAIELNSNNDYAYTELGKLYKDQRKLTKAEQSLKKAIELNPNNDCAYKELGLTYRCQEKLTKAEQSLKKAIELNPDNDKLYRNLVTIYYEIGNNELSDVYAKKADSIRDKYCNFMTMNNYRKLKQIIDKRNVKLICVQYSVRNIESLKRLFGEGVDGMIFVDNERIFKDAVRNECYKEYFRDMFGGDFGHCTEKGNRLLAENIANTILKECFGIETLVPK